MRKMLTVATVAKEYLRVEGPKVATLPFSLENESSTGHSPRDRRFLPSPLAYSPAKSYNGLR